MWCGNAWASVGKVRAVLSTTVIHNVDESQACHSDRPMNLGGRVDRSVPRVRRYFQSVAMPKAAAIAPIPIRMFQLPRSFMNGTFCPAM